MWAGDSGRNDNGHELLMTSEAAVKALRQLAPDPAAFGPAALNSCINKDVELPKLRRSVRPNYTPETLASGIQGIVHLHGIVQPNGKMGPVRVVAGLHPDLDREATSAFQRFEFNPARLKGVAVPLVVNAEFEFVR